MRISDWSSDVCSSDLSARLRGRGLLLGGRGVGDAAEAELAERVVGGDHRLPGRARVGADQHRALAVVAGDFHDRLLERLDVGAQRFAVIDAIAALRVDPLASLPGLRIAPLATGSWSLELTPDQHSVV